MKKGSHRDSRLAIVLIFLHLQHSPASGKILASMALGREAEIPPVCMWILCDLAHSLLFVP
jgi:hypothetical protein